MSECEDCGNDWRYCDECQRQRQAADDEPDPGEAQEWHDFDPDC